MEVDRIKTLQAIEELSAQIVLLPDVEKEKRLAMLALSLIPGPALGTDLFNQVARLTPCVAYEAVALRNNNDIIEVFLKRRSLDDTEAPGKVHCPGTILRSNDNKETILGRLEREFEVSIREIAEVCNWWKPRREGESIADSRGALLHWIYIVRADNATGGEWCPVNSLPSDIVWFHEDPIIPVALAHWKMLNGLY